MTHNCICGSVHFYTLNDGMVNDALPCEKYSMCSKMLILHNLVNIQHSAEELHLNSQVFSFSQWLFWTSKKGVFIMLHSFAFCNWQTVIGLLLKDNIRQPEEVQIFAISTQACKPVCWKSASQECQFSFQEANYAYSHSLAMACFLRSENG